MSLKYYITVTKRNIQSYGVKYTFKRIFNTLTKKRIAKNKKKEPVVIPPTLLKNEENSFFPQEVLYIDSDLKRLDLVFESLDDISSSKEDSTALVSAVLECKKECMPLRIISRQEIKSLAGVRKILEENDLKDFIDIEFYSFADKNVFGKIFRKLEISKNDIWRI